MNPISVLLVDENPTFHLWTHRPHPRRGDRTRGRVREPDELSRLAICLLRSFNVTVGRWCLF